MPLFILMQDRWGLLGVAGASSVILTLYTVALGVAWYRRVGEPGRVGPMLAGPLRSLPLVVAGSLAAYAVSWLVASTIGDGWWAGLVVVLAGTAAFAAVAFAGGSVLHDRMGPGPVIGSSDPAGDAGAEPGAVIALGRRATLEQRPTILFGGGRGGCAVARTFTVAAVQAAYVLMDREATTRKVEDADRRGRRGWGAELDRVPGGVRAGNADLDRHRARSGTATKQWFAMLVDQSVDSWGRSPSVLGQAARASRRARGDRSQRAATPRPAARRSTTRCCSSAPTAACSVSGASWFRPPASGWYGRRGMAGARTGVRHRRSARSPA